MFRPAVVALAVFLVGCGGGSNVKSGKVIVPAPASTPTPPPADPPPTTPPPTDPTPTLVGQGLGVKLNIVADAPLVGWTEAGTAHVGQATFSGVLQDLQGGRALTEVADPNGSSTSTLFLDGTAVASTTDQHTPVLEGANVAWIDGNSVRVNGQQVGTGSQLLMLAASPNHLAWVEEPVVDCNVIVDGATVAPGCPDTLKLVENENDLYVGWSDGESASVYVLRAGTWVQILGVQGIGVLGLDFAIRTDGSLLAAWTQFEAGEDGSAVWTSNGGSAIRVSGPTVSGFSGAGNPVVTKDGSIAYLDDSHGSAAGHFDIWLDGADLTNEDGSIDQLQMALESNGTRVLAWGDSLSVWTESVPN